MGSGFSPRPETREARSGAVFERLAGAESNERCARLLHEGKVLGWFQGRMEFGPRAPAVLEEHAGDWFELDRESPYMLLVADVAASKRRIPVPGAEALFGLNRLKQPRSEIPAVTHVDQSSRVQTVSAEIHPRFHALISRFGELSGIPIVVNTSFNVRGEPLVCSPSDAFRCFMGTEMDALAIGNLLLLKGAQTPGLSERYLKDFAPD